MNEKELLEIIEQAAKEELTLLNLSDKKLTVLPPRIGQHGKNQLPDKN